MSLYKNILVESLLAFADSFLKTNIHHSLNIIREMNNWSKEEVTQWQNENLQNLIKHAYENTSYYRLLFDKLGIRPEEIRSSLDLSKLPVLTKKDIIKNIQDFIPKNINQIKHLKASTGGTSGDPLQFLLDFKSKSFGTASSIYFWNIFDYKYGQKYIAMGSSSLNINDKIHLKNKIYNKLRGRIPLNGIGLSDELLMKYVHIIKKGNIQFIYGYASSIFLLADFIIKNNIIIDHIKACFTTSEVLTKNYRDSIKAAFNCKILDCYGAGDGGVTAFGIKDDYYCVGYNCVVEIHDCNNENSGKILCTDLLNYAMPFIRYELGDVVELAPLSEEYDYNGQIIKKINGRSSDIFHLGNGRKLTGPGFTVLFKDINVKAYSIKLISPLEISVSILKKETFTHKDEERIYESFKQQAGHECRIVIKYVDKIEYTGSGKTRYFYS